MSTFQTVQYQKEKGVGHIWLDRPDTLNAYNMAMRDELHQVLSAIAEDDEIGAVTLRGHGRAFCAGADLTEFGTAPSQVVARQVRWERDVWGAFLDLRVPLVCGIHGYCIGSGVEMALLCDLRIATTDAVFAMPEVGLGMVPAAGGTQTLPRTLGVARALEMLLTGKRVGAQEALEMGLVHQVAASPALDDEVESLASHLVSLGSTALAAKQAVHFGMEMPLAAALDMELRLSAIEACKTA